MEIILYPNKILREKCDEVKEFDQSLDRTVLDMLDVLYKKNGAGIAAPQVGIKKRIIIIDTGKSPLILINPRILKKEGKETFEEGCLSFPGIFLKIKRAKKVKVEAQNTKGEKIELEAEGLLTHVLQHEIDHLDGILFIDKIGFFKRWQLRRKLKNIAKGKKSEKSS